MVMGEPYAWCRQEELAPGEGRWRETRGSLERMGHARATMMPALETPRLSLNLLKWLYSNCICSPKTGITLIKGGTFIRNHPSSFAQSSSLASTLLQEKSVSEPHPSSRE